MDDRTLTHLLVQKIKAHNLLRNTNLYALENWQNGHFIALANIINAFLGNRLNRQQISEWGATLSPTTAKRIFNDDFMSTNQKQITDQRRINTLNKLCIFVGYADWATFKQHQLENELENEKEIVLAVVRNAIDAEINAYRKLPEIFLQDIDAYFQIDGSARARILNLLTSHQNKGWVINNPLNPSTYEIFSIKIKEINNDSAVLISGEYIYLRWFDTNIEKYTFIYNEKNEQAYLLTKQNNSWKVKSNFYPSPTNSQYLIEE